MSISNKILGLNKTKVERFQLGNTGILKKFWVAKLFGSENFVSEKMLGWKIFWVRKKFGPEKILGRQKILHQRKLGQKKMGCTKIKPQNTV